LCFHETALKIAGIAILCDEQNQAGAAQVGPFGQEHVPITNRCVWL
jgi:hypothetical protein